MHGSRKSENFDHRQGRTEPCRIWMESSEEPSRILIVLYGLIALSPIYVRGICRCRANKDCIRERRAWTIANDRHSKSANQRIRRLWGVGRVEMVAAAVEGCAKAGAS